MNKIDNLEKAVDDATQHVAAAADDIKERAMAMVDRLGRATQKELRNVRGATESAWDEVGSKAKTLQSRGAMYVHIHPLKTLLLAFGAILLVSFIFFLMRIIRK